VAGAGAAVYAIAQRFGRDPFEWGGYLGASIAADLSRRPPGTFGNPNFLGGYLALSLFLTAGALLATRRRWAQAALGVSLATEAAALAFTQTRGAWLGTLFGAVVFATLLAALTGRPWRRWLLAAGAALVVGLLALRAAQPILPAGGLLARAASIVSPSEQTASIRLALWRLVGNRWLERPVTGFGPDALAPVFQRAYGPELVEAEGSLGGQSQYDRAENAVIDTLLAAGAVGGVATLAAGILMVWSVIRIERGVQTTARQPERDSRQLAPLVAGSAAALAAHLAAQQFNVEVVGASFLAWLVAGGPVGVSLGPAHKGAERVAPSSAALTAGALLMTVAAAVAIGWWELRPLRAGVVYEAGLVAERAGKPAEAAPLLARANALWPHYYLFWAELAYADRAAARAASGPDKERLYRDALTAVDRGLSVNPAHPLVWSYWGDIAGEVAVASGDALLRNRAKAAHVRATELAPNWWRYWQNAGDTDMLMGDFPVAKERFARAAALNPSNWTLWASLGDAANRQGDKQAARSAYERALGLHPGQQTEATLERAIAALG
jgi:tetratricopeptide (TPR) repeat protein